MARVVTGTKDARMVHILKGSKDTRQIRCTACKNYATQVPDGKGGFVYVCSFCGKKYSFKMI